jgi:hypothetical protein
MSEERTITVKVYRCANGKPTCSAKAGEADCMFLHALRFGTQFYCAATGNDLERDEDGNGYIRPDAHCIVWRG